MSLRRIRHCADDWLIDFKGYTPGAITKPVFSLPKLCDGVEPGNRSMLTSGFSRRMQRLLPGANIASAGDKHPDCFESCSARVGKASQHGNCAALKHPNWDNQHGHLAAGQHQNLALLICHRRQRRWVRRLCG